MTEGGALGQGMPRRADAARNRARILEAAREQVRLHGPEVGMDAIAAAAGVAVGTLYRHFPAKGDLVGAVVREFLEAVAADVESAANRVDNGASPAAELIALIGRAIDRGASNHASKLAAQQLGVSTAHPEAERRSTESLTRLIHAGRLANQFRMDLVVADVYLLVANAPVDMPAKDRTRWLELVAPGLLVPPSDPPGGSEADGARDLRS